MVWTRKPSCPEGLESYGESLHSYMPVLIFTLEPTGGKKIRVEYTAGATDPWRVCCPACSLVKSEDNPLTCPACFFPVSSPYEGLEKTLTIEPLLATVRASEWSDLLRSRIATWDRKLQARLRHQRVGVRKIEATEARLNDVLSRWSPDEWKSS